LRAVDIDDWAWRKGCQYGTVICDLERRRIVALLPDRASGTSAAWLRDHPSIELIARDRGASYGDAAPKGAPHNKSLTVRGASSFMRSPARRASSQSKKPWLEKCQ
jgi:transposase